MPIEIAVPRNHQLIVAYELTGRATDAACFIKFADKDELHYSQPKNDAANKFVDELYARSVTFLNDRFGIGTRLRMPMNIARDGFVNDTMNWTTADRQNVERAHQSLRLIFAKCRTVGLQFDALNLEAAFQQQLNTSTASKPLATSKFWRR